MGCRWCLLSKLLVLVLWTPMVELMVETTRLLVMVVVVVEPLVVVGTTRRPPSYPALTILSPLELPAKGAMISLALISSANYQLGIN